MSNQDHTGVVTVVETVDLTQNPAIGSPSHWIVFYQGCTSSIYQLPTSKLSAGFEPATGGESKREMDTSTADILQQVLPGQVIIFSLANHHKTTGAFELVFCELWFGSL